MNTGDGFVVPLLLFTVDLITGGTIRSISHDAKIGWLEVGATVAFYNLLSFNIKLFLFTLNIKYTISYIEYITFFMYGDYSDSVKP